VPSCFLCRLSKRAHRIFNTLEPTTFLQSNDRFAFDLLKVSHVSGKEANVVLAPLPLSLPFAALWSNGSTAQGSKELMAAFHWENGYGNANASGMLLARFERPKPAPPPRIPPKTKFERDMLAYYRSGKPQEIWLKAQESRFSCGRGLFVCALRRERRGVARDKWAWAQRAGRPR
jgi:hypothetical protein